MTLCACVCLQFELSPKPRVSPASSMGAEKDGSSAIRAEGFVQFTPYTRSGHRAAPSEKSDADNR